MLKSLDKQLLCELLLNNIFCLAFSSNLFFLTWVYVSGIWVFLGILPDHGDGRLNTFSLFETWSSPLIPHTFTTLWLLLRCVQHVCMYTRYGLSHWEMTLKCSVVSHWLIPYTEWPALFVPLLMMQSGWSLTMKFQEYAETIIATHKTK